MTSNSVQQKVCLIVIDGWGISPDQDPAGDAIRNAKTPNMTSLAETYQHVPIAAHGLAVGLPDGLMGNSEVGHLNVGAGRIVYQDIVRIELSIQKKTLKDQTNLVAALDRAKKGNGRLHFLGLVSDGGVHSHINHLKAFLEIAKDAGVPQAFVHFIADGRDTAPRSAIGYLEQLEAHLKSLEYGSVATITGRYYAMDRDKRWERIQIAYDAYTQGKGEETTNPIETVQARYAKDETDEFLKPIIVNKEGVIRDEDTLIFFNFRSDRMREINQVLGHLGGSLPFKVEKEDAIPKDLSITTMTQYKADFPFPVIFPPQTMENVLAEWISKQGLKQSHIAETEKYAHVTFFFNGGSEAQYGGEDRELIASPKVATYDLKPEMSALEVGKKVADVVSSNKYEFVMCNFAPPDMVGHTGVYEKAILGVEATDEAIGLIYEACKKAGYVLFITADHGNAEKMFGDNGQPHTAHTTNKVPFIMTSKSFEFDTSKSDPALCDVAPTILQVMGLPIPSEMTGQSLLSTSNKKQRTE